MELLPMYALTAVVLEFKMAAIALVQGRGRVSTGQFVLPEDAKLFGGVEVPQEAPVVDRASKAWRKFSCASPPASPAGGKFDTPPIVDDDMPENSIRCVPCVRCLMVMRRNRAR